MGKNSGAIAKWSDVLDASSDDVDEISGCIRQIVFQFSLDCSSPVLSDAITMAEYTFIRAAIVFLISSSDRDLDKSLNWERIVLTLMFDYITAGCLPGMYSKNIEKLIKAGGRPIRTYLAEKVKSLFPRFEREYDEYLDFDLNEERRVCEAADAYAELFIDKRSEGSPSQYSRLFESIHYKGIQNLVCRQDNLSLLKLISKLNLIIRWPLKSCLREISVAAHSMGVAFIAVLLTYASGKECKNSIHDIFYSSLFHDIREVSVGDIASPIKKDIKAIFIDWEKYEKDLFMADLEGLSDSCGGRRLAELVDNVSMDEQASSSGDQTQTAKELAKFADQVCAFYEGLLFVSEGNNNLSCFDRANPILGNYLNEHSICGVDIIQVMRGVRKLGWPIEH